MFLSKMGVIGKLSRREREEMKRAREAHVNLEREGTQAAWLVWNQVSTPLDLAWTKGTWRQFDCLERVLEIEILDSVGPTREDTCVQCSIAWDLVGEVSYQPLQVYMPSKKNGRRGIPTFLLGLMLLLPTSLARLAESK